MLINNKRGLIFVCVILVSLLKIYSSQYCSAYCSYQMIAGSYNSKCTGTASNDCTKCDQLLFTMGASNPGSCIPHNKFNQTLYIQDLAPGASSNSSSWTEVPPSNVRLNSGSGYNLLQIYQTTTTASSGLFYRQYTLPAHSHVRLRFFILRQTGSSLNFYYHIDNLRIQYSLSNFPASSTLGDIVTSGLIFHQDTTVRITFQATSVDTQWIGVKQVLLFVTFCSPNCQFCNSPTSCVQCKTFGNGTKTYLHNGACYFDCPQTLFQNGTLNTCDACLNQCQNCDANSTYCVQCKFQGIFESFLLNNSCYHNCPDGFTQSFQNNTCICPSEGYFINSSYFCQACAPQCLSCFGTTRIQCYNCQSGFFLVKGTNWCSKTCPSNQYGDYFTRLCYPCAPICSSCSDTGTKCTGCFFPLAMRFLYNQTCLVDCPDGFGKNIVLRKCQKCPPFFYSFNGSCVMDCPQLFIANIQSKSCVHLGMTNYSLPIVVSNIDILMDGFSVVLSVYFSQGLNSLSKNWLFTQSYYNVYLTTKAFSVVMTGIDIQNNNTIKFIFKIPTFLQEDNMLTLNINKKLNSTNNVYYTKSSASFKASQYPYFLKQYFKKTQVYYFNIIFIPILLILATMIAFHIRASYQLLIQNIRAYQLIGLGVFMSYPMQSRIYYLFQGFNYFNLQFFPNIYNWFVPPFSNTFQEQIQIYWGFQFYYGDMDFIRMIGSILTFIAFWITFLFVFKFFISKDQVLLGWLMRLGLDVIQIKIIHSFWNSLIFTILNSEKNNLYILWVHVFSYVFMGFVLFKYYEIYQTTQKINYPFIWRVIATLFISIAIYNKMDVLLFLIILSFGFGIQQFSALREINKKTVNFKYGNAFIARDFIIAIMPFISIMAISLLIFYKDQMEAVSVIIIVGIFAYLLLILQGLIMVWLNYFYKRRQKNVIAIIKKDKNQKWKQKDLYKQVQNNSTFQNVSEQFRTQNDSYIKDQIANQFKNNRKDLDSQTSKKVAQQSFFEESLTNNKIDIKGMNSTNAMKKNMNIKTMDIQGMQIKQNQNQTEQEGPIQQKFRRINKTEMIPRKYKKFQYLIAQQKQKQQDVQFEKISLSPRKKRTATNQNIGQTNGRPKSSLQNNVFVENNQEKQTQ